MGQEELRQAYFEVMLQEPGTTLEAFMLRVQAGEFGPQPREVVERFLRWVEGAVLSSIQTRAGANPDAAPEAEALAEAKREEIAALIARFAPRPRT